MLKKILCLLIGLLLAACGGDDNLRLTKTDDLADKRIGLLIGSAYENYVKEHYPAAKLVYFNAILDMVLGTVKGQCDGILLADAVVPLVLAQHPELAVLENEVIRDESGFGFRLDDPQLREQFNQFLAELRDSGELQKIDDGWRDNFDGMPLPQVGGDGSGGEIRFATTGTYAPISAMRDGQPAGFDIDLIYRFATRQNLTVKTLYMDFGGLIAALASDKVDVIGNGISITPERQKSIAFSDPYNVELTASLARKDQIAGGENKNADAGKWHRAADVAQKRLAVISGHAADIFARKNYPQATFVQFTTAHDIVLAIEAGRADAALITHDEVPYILAHHPQLGVVEAGVYMQPLGLLYREDSTALRDDVDKFLRPLVASGEWQKIYDGWVNRFDEMPIPRPGGDGSGGILRVGTTGIDVPSSAMRGDALVGYDIDFIYRYATARNLRVEFFRADFPGLLAALKSGKINVIANCVTIERGRVAYFIYSTPYVETPVDMLALKKNIGDANQATAGGENHAAPTLGFFAQLARDFYENFVQEKRYLLILHGLWTTLVISFWAAILGTVLGAGVCFLRMKKNRAANWTARTFITLLRGTPILVLLMLMFYVVFAKVDINPVAVAVLAFGLNFAAYVSEMFRTAISSIGLGQTEAGVAMGFSPLKTFVHIILPQAVQRVLPVYKGEFISLVKMTSVVGYIAVEDLTKASDIIRSRTFDAFMPLLLVAALYFLLAWALTLLLNRLEFYTDPQYQLRKQK